MPDNICVGNDYILAMDVCIGHKLELCPSCQGADNSKVGIITVDSIKTHGKLHFLNIKTNPTKQL